MKADVHLAKAERMAATQAKLDPAIDWETIVETCYMSAHHYILAGTEWAGVSHLQNHLHSMNPTLLQQANAPTEVNAAWSKLEQLRAGNVYGAKTSGTASDDARASLQIIDQWVLQQRANNVSP